MIITQQVSMSIATTEEEIVGISVRLNQAMRHEGLVLSILVNVIWNQAESWLNSLIPHLIPAIPC